FVEYNAALDSSQFVRLQRTGTVLHMSLTGTLWAAAEVKAGEEGKWTIYVDRRALKAFLATASGSDIEVFYQKDKLTLKANQRLEVQARAPIAGYEVWKPQKSFDLPDDQKVILKTAVKYLPKAAGLDNVDAIYFAKDFGIIATDTLFMVAVIGTPVNSEFFLPGGVAGVLSDNQAAIAPGKDGVGIVMPSGVVYQPLSSELDKYPVDKCKATVQIVLKEKPLTQIKADEMVKALSTASQFLMDKNEAALVEPGSNSTNLSITIDMTTGRFQRHIPVVGSCKDVAPTKWPIKQLLPWFDYIVAVNSNAAVEYIKLGSAGAFRYKEGIVTQAFMFADI